MPLRSGSRDSSSFSRQEPLFQLTTTALSPKQSAMGNHQIDGPSPSRKRRNLGVTAQRIMP